MHTKSTTRGRGQGRFTGASRRIMTVLLIVALGLSAAILAPPPADAQLTLEDTETSKTLIPACIESDLVQKHSGARRKSVGDSFTRKGLTYLIVSGSPTCQFDCFEGFDMNCDGKLGDFCSSEHDRSSVLGIRNCLKELAEREEALAKARGEIE